MNKAERTKKKTTRKIATKTGALTLREKKTKSNKEAFIEAMNKTLGNVTKSCEMVGLGRTTFYNYYDSDAEFARRCDEASERALDFAESQLFVLINGPTETVRDEEGNIRTLKKSPVPSAVIFYLKTKGRKRGYMESGDDGSREPIKVSYEGFTEEEIKQLESTNE